MSTKKETKVNGIICISRKEWDLKLKIVVLSVLEEHINKCKRDREYLENSISYDENGNYAGDWDSRFGTQAEANLILQAMLEELGEKI